MWSKDYWEKKAIHIQKNGFFTNELKELPDQHQISKKSKKKIIKILMILKMLMVFFGIFWRKKR